MVNFCENEGCTKRLIASSPGYHCGLCAKCYKSGKYEVKIVKSKVHTCINFEKFEISIPIYSTVKVEAMAPVDERVCDYSYITEEVEVVEPKYGIAVLQEVEYGEVVTITEESTIGALMQTLTSTLESLHKLHVSSSDILKVFSGIYRKDEMVQLDNLCNVEKLRGFEDIQIDRYDFDNVMDISFVGDALRVFKDKWYIISHPTIKQYEFKQYIEGKPVVKKQPYRKTTLDKYIDNKGYGDSPKDGYHILSKLIIDNKIEFKYDNSSYDVVYYDIETADPNKPMTVPDCDDDTAFIGCICAVLMDDAGIHVYSWKLTQHIVNDEELHNRVKFTEDITVFDCKNDRIMSYEFFKFLHKRTKPTVIIGFNSSSSNVYNKKQGYDLPWLQKRCPSELTPIKRKATCRGVQFKQIIGYKELPMCYFLDSMIVQGNSIPKDNKLMLENNKLESYLTVMGLEGKVDMDYSELHHKLTRMGDITDVIHYCIEDCYALYRLESKIHGLKQLIAIGMTNEVSFSSALYNTMAKNITLKEMRLFDTHEYSFSYEIKEQILLDKSVRGAKFQGAYTYTNQQSMLKVYTGTIFDGDFTSLYPSSIIYGNLSLETYITEDEARLLQEDEYEVFEYFEEKLNRQQRFLFMKSTSRYGVGIIPNYLKEQKVKRKEIKNLQKGCSKGSDDWIAYEIKQTAVKLGMNSMYGLLSATTSLFSLPCASVCTYLGRRAALKTKEICENRNIPILLMDTDSVMGVFQSKDQYDEVRQQIKNEIGDDFDLVEDKVFTHYMASKSKKSYIAITHKKDGETGEVIIDEKTGKPSEVLIVTGASWSLMTNQAKSDIRQLFTNILNTGDVNGNVKQFYLYHKRKILSGLKLDNWRDILKPYCRMTKLSGSSILADRLRTKYSGERYADGNVLPCVEILPRTKGDRVANLIYYVGDLEIYPDEINVAKLLGNYMQTISKMIRKVTDVYVDSYEIQYRVESFERTGDIKSNIGTVVISHENDTIAKFRKLTGCTKKDYSMYNEKCGTGISVHEIFNDTRMYRLFIDLDDHSNDKDRKMGGVRLLDVAYEITREIEKVVGLAVKWRYSKSVKGVHCISNLSMYISGMRELMMLIMAIKPEFRKYVDVGIYHNNGSIRFINCPKINLSNSSIDWSNIHVPVGTKDLDEFIISNLEGTHYYNPVAFSNKHVIDISNNNTEIYTEYEIKSISAKINSLGIKVSNYSINDRFINYIIDHSAGIQCCICKRCHNKRNMYVYRIDGNDFMLGCHGEGQSVKITIEKNPEEVNDEKVDAVLLPDYTQSTRRLMKIVDKFSKKAVNDNWNLDVIDSKGDLTLDMVYNFSNRVTCIKSGLGTGKTKVVRDYLKTFDGSLLVISFRRSFSKHISGLLNIKNYEDITEKVIDFTPNTRIIVQVESLYRLHFKTYPDLLLIDETMSVLSQLDSVHVHRGGREYSVYSVVQDVLSYSRKIICMDGLLSDLTIKLIKELSEVTDSECNYIENRFFRESGELPVYNVTNKNDAVIHILSNIARILDSRGSESKIACFITTKSMAYTIQNSLVSRGCKVICITGDDCKIVEDGKDGEKDKTMGKLKKEVYTNVENIFDNCNVFIYTSTMTAGVSIENTEVDLMITYYGGRTCTPIDCIQGMHRIRRQKRRLLYYNSYTASSDTIEKGLTSPASNTISQNELNLSMFRYFSLIPYIKALKAQSTVLRDDTFFKLLLIDMNIQVKVFDIDHCGDETIEIYRDTMLEYLIFNLNYIPTNEDIRNKEAMDLMKDEVNIPANVKITQYTVYINQLIDMFKIYDITGETFYSSKDEVDWESRARFMVKNRYTNAKRKAIEARYGFNDLSEYGSNRHKVQEILEYNRTIMEVVAKMGHRLAPGVNAQIDLENKKRLDRLDALMVILKSNDSLTAGTLSNIIADHPVLKAIHTGPRGIVARCNEILKLDNMIIETYKSNGQLRLRLSKVELIR